MAGLIQAVGPITLRDPQPDHFAALVRSIMYQQLAGAAKSIHLFATGTLVAFGHSPHTLGCDVASNLRFHLYQDETTVATVLLVETQNRMPCCSRTCEGIEHDRILVVISNVTN